MSHPDLAALARDSAPNGPSTTTRVPLPRSRWKTRIALPMALLLITATLLGVAAADALRPAVPVRVVPVMVKTDVDAQPVGTVVVKAPGWVEPDPFPTAVSALADGVVAEVLVLAGQRVAAGQVLARLVAEDAQLALARAEATLARRAADLASAEAALVEAESNWTHPTELRRKLDTATAQLAEKRAELKRWPSELARATARAKHLQAEFERMEPLHRQQQASDIELIAAEQAYAAQQAEVAVVREREAVLAAQINALEAEVTAARERLELRITDTRALATGRAAVAAARAAVEHARAQRDEAALRLARMEVRAPVAGIVLERLVEPGSKVRLGADTPRSAQIVRLYDPQKLQVRVDVPLVDAAKVATGQPAEIIVDVLPERVFAGELTRFVHQADLQKNTLQVKVAIQDPVPEIKPEMLAQARFLARPTEDPVDAANAAEQLWVPAAALLDRAGAPHVWLADQVENVAHLRPVTVGQTRLDDWVRIRSGLQPGDRVVVQPPADLSDGMRIRLLEAVPQ